jgi:hypothetical protein
MHQHQPSVELKISEPNTGVAEMRGYCGWFIGFLTLMITTIGGVQAQDAKRAASNQHLADQAGIKEWPKIEKALRDIQFVTDVELIEWRANDKMMPKMIVTHQFSSIFGNSGYMQATGHQISKVWQIGTQIADKLDLVQINMSVEQGLAWLVIMSGKDLGEMPAARLKELSGPLMWAVAGKDARPAGYGEPMGREFCKGRSDPNYQDFCRRFK